MSATTNGFKYARRAPNVFGGKQAPFHPWFQVVREVAGSTVVLLDFVRSWGMAEALAGVAAGIFGSRVGD